MSAAPLPGPLAEPLHLLEPAAPAWGWFAAALALLALLAAFLWLRRRLAAAGRAVPAAPPPAAPRDAIAEQIRAIRRTYAAPGAAAGEPRLGCHRLSLLLRRHYAPAGGGAASEAWTARELAARLGGAVGRVLLHLANLQFGRREPSRDELETACDLALATVAAVPAGAKGGAGR